jgi:hypothetical protein
MKHIKTYEDTTPLRGLSKDRELPMVTGIAEILRMVKDVGNRREIAEAQIEEFKREGIRFNYSEFLKLCDL